MLTGLETKITENKSLVTFFYLVHGGKSQKQRCVALSTAEAEYVAMYSATQEAMWLRQLIAEITSSKETPILVYEDNQSGIAIAKKPTIPWQNQTH